MNKKLALIAMTAFFMACASSNGPMASSSGPSVDVQLDQLGSNGNVFYFRGPINVQYELAINNPTNEPVTLRRLDLRSEGPGAYSIRTGAQPITVKVPPSGSTRVTLSAWASSRGGYLTADEPVTIRGIAYFDSPKGPFTRLFTETLTQFGR